MAPGANARLSADDIDEDITSGGRDPAVPVQHCEQQREPVRFEPDRDAIREIAKLPLSLGKGKG